MGGMAGLASLDPPVESGIDVQTIYTVVQIKTCHCIFVHNFGKCEPIFKMVSLFDLSINGGQDLVHINYYVLNV